MGIRKDYYVKEAALVLAMVKAVHLHDLVFGKKVLPYQWVKRSLQVSARELDEAGIRVHVEGDVYDFVPGRELDASYCEEVVANWRMEAVAKIEAKDMTVVRLADRCGLSRQSLYRIVKARSSGLQHLFTLRGANPIVLWCGKPLSAEYARCRADLEAYNLMEPLV